MKSKLIIILTLVVSFMVTQRSCGCVYTADPVISITYPHNSDTFIKSGEAPTIYVITSQEGGWVDEVEYFSDGISMAKTSSRELQWPNWANAAVGSHILTAKAYGRSSKTTMSDPVQVYVLYAQSPIVSITSPQNGEEVGDGDTVSATASQPDGLISKVEFYIDSDTLINTDTTAPYTFNWNDVPSGNHTLTARAYADSGQWTDSGPVSITTYPTLAGNLYAAAYPLAVYKYLGDGEWTNIFPWTNPYFPEANKSLYEVSDAVYCLAEYKGQLYAGGVVVTQMNSAASAWQSIVWKYNGGTSWTQVGGDTLSSYGVSDLIVYNGRLYAAVYGGLCVLDDVNNVWLPAVNLGWPSIHKTFQWGSDLFISGRTLPYGRLAHYDGTNTVIDNQAGLPGYISGIRSCHDFELYNGMLYVGDQNSSTGGGDILSCTGELQFPSYPYLRWSIFRQFPKDSNLLSTGVWELEKFRRSLYIANGPFLKRYDEVNDVTNIWTEPHGPCGEFDTILSNDIISMIKNKDYLIFGTGWGDDNYSGEYINPEGCSTLRGKVCIYDGNSSPQTILDMYQQFPLDLDMHEVSGIQTLILYKPLP